MQKKNEFNVLMPLKFRFVLKEINLTLIVPITTAAGDKFCDIFPNFRKN